MTETLSRPNPQITSGRKIAEKIAPVPLPAPLLYPAAIMSSLKAMLQSGEPQFRVDSDETPDRQIAGRG